MANGAAWTDAELEILFAHPGLTARELCKFLPGRSPQAVGNMRARRMGHRGGRGAVLAVTPVSKAAGEYRETLSSYLVDDFECMEIWLKWNGYASHKELSRDERGWVSLLCIAK